MKHTKTFTLTNDLFKLFSIKNGKAAPTADPVLVGKDDPAIISIRLPKEILPPPLTGTHEGFLPSAVVTSAILTLHGTATDTDSTAKLVLGYPTTDENGEFVACDAPLLVDYAPLFENAYTGYSFDVTASLRGAQANGEELLLLLTVLGNGSFAPSGADTDTPPTLTLTYEASYGDKTFGETKVYTPTPDMTATVDVLRGNLMYAINDFTVGQGDTAFTVRHHYNSAMAMKLFTKNHGIDTAHFSPMRLGYGWRCNLFCSVVRIGDIYVYTDEHGNEHPLYAMAGGMYGNDGLIYSEADTTLTCPSFKKIFDGHGRMVDLLDGMGRQILHLCYIDNRISMLTDCKGTVYTFTYSEYGYLEKIYTDNIERPVIRFGCANGFLRYVWQSDLTVMEYKEESDTSQISSVAYRVDGGDKKYTTFEFCGARVAKASVYEFSENDKNLYIVSKDLYTYDCRKGSVDLVEAQYNPIVLGEFDPISTTTTSYSLGSTETVGAFTKENDRYIPAHTEKPEGENLLTAPGSWHDENGNLPDAEQGLDGEGAMLLEGSIDSPRHLCKEITIPNGAAACGDYMLSGFAKARAFFGRKREDRIKADFGLRAEIVYTDGETETHSKPFSPLSAEWQYTALHFSKTKCKPIAAIRVFCDYRYQKGTALFDGLTLLRENEKAVTALDRGLHTLTMRMGANSDYIEFIEDSEKVNSYIHVYNKIVKNSDNEEIIDNKVNIYLYKDKLPLPKSHTLVGATLTLYPAKPGGLGRIEYANGLTLDYNGEPIDIPLTARKDGKYSCYLKAPSLGTDASFHASGKYAPVLTLRYILSKKPLIANKSIALTDTVRASLDLEGGGLSPVFPLLSDSAAPFYAVHTANAGGTELGVNFCHNFCQTLTEGNGDIPYIYTDALGNAYALKERFYYSPTPDTYAFVKKEDVLVRPDGSLWYGDKAVTREVYTETGWVARTELCGIDGADILETRTEELMKAEEELAGYEGALDEYTVVKEDDGCKVASGTPKNYRDYCDFLALCKADGNLLLSASEAIGYRSTLHSLAELENQNESLGHQLEEMTLDQALIQDSLDNASDDPDNDNYISPEEKESILARCGIAEKQYDCLKKQQSLYAGEEEKTTQKALLEAQLAEYLRLSGLYIEQLKKQAKAYFALKLQVAKIKKAIPVRYMSKGDITKCFNESGELCMICHRDGRMLCAERDPENRILRLVDEKERAYLLSYTDGLLYEIVTPSGERVTLDYENRVLMSISADDGNAWSFAYRADGRLAKITSAREHMSAVLFYDGDRFSRLVRYTDASSVTHGEKNGEPFLCSCLGLTYANDGVTLSADGEVTEQYILSRTVENAETVEHRSVSRGLVVAAERQAYISPERQIAVTAKRACLGKLLASFAFEGGERVVRTLNALGSPIREESDWVDFHVAKGTVAKRRYTRTYTHDAQHRSACVRTEVTEVAGDTERSYTEVQRLAYNAEGAVVRRESYIEGEEYANGKSIEETVYDGHGNVLRTLSYNTLDPSSKQYTEIERDDTGRILSAADATGLYKTRYEYKDNGSSTVVTEQKPNGARLSFGNIPGAHTAITLSTEAGEENSNTVRRTAGLVTELESGGRRINYTYDGKRRITGVTLDGEPYIAYTYSDNVIEDESKVDRIKATLQNGTSLLSVYDKQGNLRRATCNGDLMLHTTYDAFGKPLIHRDAMANTLSAYTYNTFDRITAYRRTRNDLPVLTEEYGYDSLGKNVTRHVTFGDKVIDTAYTYRKDAARTLDSLTVGGLTVRPVYDPLGRTVGRVIEDENGKLSGERISLRKVGDHTTNAPAAIRFERRKGDACVSDGSLQYHYDSMGNITEVREDGRLLAHYTYDAVGRLVREDNRKLGKTTLFTYDNRGNLTAKEVAAYTAPDVLSDAIEGERTVYEYEGEHLVRYGDEVFAYDVIGNPTTYRGKAAVFERGRQMASLDGNTFTYGGDGRRIGKNGISFLYDRVGNLIYQSNGMIFLYDHAGLCGVTYDGETYIYRKDAQENILALLDKDGNTVVKYTYDAWGNHTVEDSTECGLGMLNPFRYRGYYYDTETGLYYLQTRYYDPEIGRFVTIDDVAYLDPDTVGGLNLYAYCNNNPVMCVDPRGTVAGLAVIYSIFAVFTLAGTAIGFFQFKKTDGGNDEANVNNETNGENKKNLLKSLVLGTALGLAVGGAFVASAAVFIGAFGSVAFLGVPVAQAFALGGLAMDITAFFIAPLFGIEMEGIEQPKSAVEGTVPKPDERGTNIPEFMR